MTTATPTTAQAPAPLQTDRRALLVGAGLAAAGIVALPFLRRAWYDSSAVFVARNQRYDGPLEQTIRDGLLATGFDAAGIRGCKVLLKPNLVEPTRKCPQMTTNPAVVVAAANVFRNWGASVVVGEGPGHVRDTEMALVESGLQDALDDARLQFVDLNYSQVGWLGKRGPANRAARLLLSAASDRGRPDRVPAQDENPSLGGLHRRAKESVRRDSRHQVRLAQECAALCGHSPSDLRHQCHAAQDGLHRGRHPGHGRRRADHGQP